MNKPKAIFCWSGGKDSAYCLHQVLTDQSFDIKYLLTTFNDEFQRVSMHGIREKLLDQQVASIGIPLLKVRTSQKTNQEYEAQMSKVLLQAKTEGITHVIFGDIFLEDLRKYRENNLAKIGLTGVFPLWKKDTKILINDFLNLGFASITCCTNDGYLGQEFVGQEISQQFLQELPANVDPCGENGEYHSFCYKGPIFKKEIKINIGKKIYKPLEIKTTSDCNLATNISTKGFWFCDLTT